MSSDNGSGHNEMELSERNLLLEEEVLDTEGSCSEGLEDSDECDEEAPCTVVTVVSPLDAELLEAVRIGDCDGVRRLVVLGASVRASDPGGGQNCAEIAASKGHDELLQLLFDEDKDVAQGRPLLRLAVDGRHRNCLQMLLSRKEHVDDINKGAKNPLLKAVDLGWVEGVKLLLDEGVNINDKNSKNKTALQMATNKESVEMVKLISEAARRGDESERKEIIDVLNNDGMSPLLIAYHRGNAKIVEILLGVDAHVGIKDKAGRTILHTRTTKDSTPILNILYKMRPKEMKSLSTESCKEGTPLQAAVSRGDVSTLIFLATKFPDTLQVKDNQSRNILHLISDSDKPEVLKYFISRLRQKDEPLLPLIKEVTMGNFCKPLHFALMRRQVDFAFALIEAGADLAAVCYEEHVGNRSAIDIFIHLLPLSIEKLTVIFDRSIQKKKGEASVKVNYNVLWSDNHKTGLMTTEQNGLEVVKALQETGNKLGQEKLFEHPLVESFLHLHWKRLQGPYLVLVVLNILFSSFLSLLVLFNSLFDDLVVTWTFTALVIFFMVPLVIYEVQCVGMKQPFPFRLKFLVRCACFALSVASFVPGTPPACPAFSVLLAWFDVLLLISQIPRTGYYMLMFLEVARKYLKLLLSFSFLIFGFAIAFMSIYRMTSPFESFLPALMKTSAMMTGELEYNALYSATFNKELGLTISSKLAVSVMFVLFVVFIGLVLTNLFVAVAVIDISKFHVISKRTSFLGVYEDFLLSAPRFCCSHGIMYNLFSFTCAFVRKFNPKLAESWKSFRNIERCCTIEVLNTNDTPKFPKWLNTAIIGKGYGYRDKFLKDIEEKTDVSNRKKALEQESKERERNRETLAELQAGMARLSEKMSEILTLLPGSSVT